MFKPISTISYLDKHRCTLTTIERRQIASLLEISKTQLSLKMNYQKIEISLLLPISAHLFDEVDYFTYYYNMEVDQLDLKTERAFRTNLSTCRIQLSEEELSIENIELTVYQYLDSYHVRATIGLIGSNIKYVLLDLYPSVQKRLAFAEEMMDREEMKGKKQSLFVSRENAKPIEELEITDFDQFPFWEFALELEGIEEMNETWVRPCRRQEFSMDLNGCFGRGKVYSVDQEYLMITQLELVEGILTLHNILIVVDGDYLELSECNFANCTVHLEMKLTVEGKELLYRKRVTMDEVRRVQEFQLEVADDVIGEIT